MFLYEIFRDDFQDFFQTPQAVHAECALDILTEGLKYRGYCLLDNGLKNGFIL